MADYLRWFRGILRFLSSVFRKETGSSKEQSDDVSPSETKRPEEIRSQQVPRSKTAERTTGVAPASPTERIHAAEVPEKRKSPIPYIIGLDFGTLSTKILLRKRGEIDANVVIVDEEVDGYPWFSSPALVRVKNGLVYFGGRCLKENGGTLYRSLKITLLRPVMRGIQVPRTQQFPDGISSDLLVALYLSWCLRKVRADTERRAGGVTPPAFLNMAAPMNHLEDESLKKRYLKIAQAAWETVFGNNQVNISQGIRLSSVRSIFEEYLENGDQIQDKSIRKFDVLPETVAPIVSLSSDPRMSDGLFLIVDMGAGTTELSVTHVGGSGANRKVLCYSDHSILLGCDNFESIEERNEIDTPVGEKLAALRSRFIKEYRHCWGTAYRKDANHHAGRKRWKSLNVLLTGGGARRRDILRAIRQSNPIYAWPSNETLHKIMWHDPMDIVTNEEYISKPRDNFSLLTVAQGLSIPRQQWPESFAPGEVEPLEPDEEVEHPPPDWYLH